MCKIKANHPRFVAENKGDGDKNSWISNKSEAFVDMSNNNNMVDCGAIVGEQDRWR